MKRPRGQYQVVTMSGRRTTRSSTRSSESLSEGERTHPLGTRNFQPVRSNTSTPNTNSPAKTPTTTIPTITPRRSNQPPTPRNLQHHTPYHLLNSNKHCICGELTVDSRGMLKCGSCEILFHAECVGLSFLNNSTQPESENGLYIIPEWVCPDCIISSRMNGLDGVLSERITDCILRVLNPGSPLFEAIAQKCAEILTLSSAATPEPMALNDQTVIPNINIGNSAPAWSTVAQNEPVRQDPVPQTSQPPVVTDSTSLPTTVPNTGPKTPRPPQPKLVLHCSEVNKSRPLVETALGDIPVSFMRCGVSTITIGFPNKQCHEKASAILSSGEHEFLRVTSEALGKLTLRGVPTDGLPVSPQPSPSENAKIRESIVEKLRAKNDLLTNVEDLSVIFFKPNQQDDSTATVGIRLPVSVKIKLLQQGRVYFGMSSIRVHNRVHVKRCSHCQNLGHYPDRCPTKHLNPVCMFCAQEHSSETCPVRDLPDQHSCINCTRSNAEGHTPHHAGSSTCPTYRLAYDKASKNAKALNTLASKSVTSTVDL